MYTLNIALKSLYKVEQLINDTHVLYLIYIHQQQPPITEHLMPKVQSLYKPLPYQMLETEFWVKQKRIALLFCQAKQDKVGSCFKNPSCPNLGGGYVEEFYSNSSRVRVADKIRVCSRFQVIGLLILVNFSGSCNLASGGFLLLFLDQKLLKSALWNSGKVMKTGVLPTEMGIKKASVTRSPTESSSQVTQFLCARHCTKWYV